MSDDEDTLFAAAVAAASVTVVSTAEEQRTAAKRKRRTQWTATRSRQQFGAYELLVSELHGSDEQLLYIEFNRVSLEDLTLLTAIAPYCRLLILTFTQAQYCSSPILQTAALFW